MLRNTKVMLTFTNIYTTWQNLTKTDIKKKIGENLTKGNIKKKTGDDRK